MQRPEISRQMAPGEKQAIAQRDFADASGVNGRTDGAVFVVTDFNHGQIDRGPTATLSARAEVDVFPVEGIEERIEAAEGEELFALKSRVAADGVVRRRNTAACRTLIARIM